MTIVQYAGDVREAAERLAATGVETYRGQRYTVDYVQALAARCASVVTIVGQTAAPSRGPLPGGGEMIGAGFADGVDGRAVARLVAETRPTRLILRTPLRPVLRWAQRNRCRTLLLLADSFDDASLKSRIGKALLARRLRSPVFEVIGNHGRAAARQLVAAGVDPRRVVAWDYPAFDTPAARPPKTAAGRPPAILFVGMLIAEKGVHDLIAAIALLAARGIATTLQLAGRGDEAALRDAAARAGVADRVTVLGAVANDRVVPLMAAADIVAVPSHHAYSEGLPLTIYEAYCARTPLIVSDHPMFAGAVADGASGLVVRERDPAALADAVARLADDAALYARLSEGNAAAWERLQVPVKWHELIDRWLDDTPASRDWIASHGIGGGAG